MDFYLSLVGSEINPKVALEPLFGEQPNYFHPADFSGVLKQPQETKTNSQSLNANNWH